MRKFWSVKPYRKLGRAFNFIIGGRGVGKTFNSIYESNYVYDEKIILMRRTQTEIDLITSHGEDVELSPFAKINERSRQKKYGLIPTNYHIGRVNEKIYGIYDGEKEEKKYLGMILALSTVASIRGFSAVDISTMIYDEFIPEKHVKKIGKGTAEADAFFNAYETINRDREESGEKPIQVFLLSNANDLNCPLLSELGFDTIFEKMRRKKIPFIDLPQRNATLTLYEDREFKEVKRKTALYQLTKGTKFYDMALENDFSFNDFSLIKSMPLSEFNPWCIYGDVCIYRHKSIYLFYVSPHIMSCDFYDITKQDTQRFVIERGRFLYGAFIEGAVIFENFHVKMKILEVIG